MIYYIVEVQRNGNETVISSWNDVETATQRLEGCRSSAAALGMFDTEYRLDTVMDNAEVRAANAAIPLPHFTAEAPNGDWTLVELFGREHNMPTIGYEKEEAIICRECGALVGIPQRHVDFHNKLLP